MTDNPTFEPRDGSPTIQVHIRTIRKEEKITNRRMWKEQQQQQQQNNNVVVEEQAAEAAKILENKTRNENAPVPTVPPPITTPDTDKSYEGWASSVTTCEYDVVACKDFVEEKGCWIQNMPEEIKRANPQFVPS